ncbi:MAG: DUF1844 domain-containing protein [Bdellovibrionales bacterium]|nr:DUF1844 domain-containing protein [Bdellovibrionales bacterium]
MTPESPKLDLTTFFLSVGSSALMALGMNPKGEFEKKNANLQLARHNIDLLELLVEKTKGNRTSDEDRLLQQLLFETRMRYVEVQKKVEGA